MCLHIIYKHLCAQVYTHVNACIYTCVHENVSVQRPADIDAAMCGRVPLHSDLSDSLVVLPTRAQAHVHMCVRHKAYTHAQMLEHQAGTLVARIHAGMDNFYEYMLTCTAPGGQFSAGLIPRRPMQAYTQGPVCMPTHAAQNLAHIVS